MDKSIDVVRLLSHTRHDWLNRIQLIKGYTQLGDTEKVNEYIDFIVQEARKETHVSNLLCEQFVSFILTYNWNQHPFVLEYEVEGEVRDIPIFDEELYQFATLFFKEIDCRISSFETSQMTITIQLTEEDVRFYFDFFGKLTSIEELEKWLKEQEVLNRLTIGELTITTEELSVELCRKEW